MAEKAQEMEKRHRIREAMQKEYRGENLILAVLAIIAIELGVLLLTGYLEIGDAVFLIGEYWKFFAWFLVGLGTLSLLLSVSSFFIPSFKEIRHITGLKKSEFLSNIVQVIIFVIILALFFLLCDWVLESLINLLA